MQFITIKNQYGQTIAVNPKKITSICMSNTSVGTVSIFVGQQEILTKFTDIRAAADYIEKAYVDRSIASGNREAVDALWKVWGDI